MVGHTHEDIDQYFSKLSQYLKYNNAHTLPDFLTAVQRCYADVPEANVINHIFDIKSWLLPHLHKLHNHSHYHIFRFSRDATGLVVMHYKEWNESQWEPTTCGIQLFKSFPENPPSVAKPTLNRLDFDKLTLHASQYRVRCGISETSQKWWIDHLQHLKAICSGDSQAEPTPTWPLNVLREAAQRQNHVLPADNTGGVASINPSDLPPHIQKAYQKQVGPHAKVYTGNKPPSHDNDPELEPGTKVMLENTCQKERKGEDAYMGPYVIHSSVGKGVYTLRTMKGKVLKKKCNVKRLKVYIERDPPADTPEDNPPAEDTPEDNPPAEDTPEDNPPEDDQMDDQQLRKSCLDHSRLYRTGAFLYKYRAEEDGDIDLSYLFREEGDYALSKDVDVVLWQSFRAHNNLPPVTDALDFVIVNNQLHNEFDEFKKAEIEPDITYLQMNSLLQHYCRIKSHLHAFIVTKYGKSYLKLTSSLVDDLCIWMKEKSKHGQVGSEPGCVITDDTTCRDETMRSRPETDHSSSQATQSSRKAGSGKRSRLEAEQSPGQTTQSSQKTGKRSRPETDHSSSQTTQSSQKAGKRSRPETDHSSSQTTQSSRKAGGDKRSRLETEQPGQTTQASTIKEGNIIAICSPKYAERPQIAQVSKINSDGTLHVEWYDGTWNGKWTKYTYIDSGRTVVWEEDINIEHIVLEDISFTPAARLPAEIQKDLKKLYKNY